MRVTTSCARDTEQLGEKLASVLRGKEMIALFGDLGAGKTAFTGAINSSGWVREGL